MFENIEVEKTTKLPQKNPVPSGVVDTEKVLVSNKIPLSGKRL